MEGGGILNMHIHTCILNRGVSYTSSSKVEFVCWGYRTCFWGYASVAITNFMIYLRSTLRTIILDLFMRIPLMVRPSQDMSIQIRFVADGCDMTARIDLTCTGTVTDRSSEIFHYKVPVPVV